jgi:hypothetical protein
LKPTRTILTVQQLADMRGYPNAEKLVEEARKAGILLEIAGTPHIFVEDWDEHLMKAAQSQLSSRSKSSKTLADTDQLGIVNSNLKRLPESIRIKERKLKAKQALYEDAATDNEKYILSGEISRLEIELERHRENLKKAQQRQKQILGQRATELQIADVERSKTGKEISSADEEPSDE